MHSVLIIDDDKVSNDYLKLMLNDYRNQYVVLGDVLDLKKSISAINQIAPSLIFLSFDIERNLLQQIIDLCVTEHRIEIIGISEDSKKAYKAIKSGVFDYLLKPISSVELKKVLERFSLSFEKSNLVRDSLFFEAFFRMQANEDRLLVKSNYGINYLNAKEIIYLTASGSYTNVFTLFKEKQVLSSSNLKYFESILPSYFIRVHRKSIVNVNYITEYVRKEEGDLLRLIGGSEIRVSLRKKDEVLKLLEGKKS